MKFLIKSLTALLLVGMITSAAQAQIFKKLKEKAKDAVEQKAEEKIDEEMQKAADRMVEDSWNAVFGEVGENGQPHGSLPFSLNNDVTTEDIYNFDVITTMQITSVDADGQSEPPMYMDMHFKEDAQYTGTKFRGENVNQEQGELFIIYDFNNSAMVMLMESEEGKFSFAYDWKQAMANTEQISEDIAEDEVNWEKTEEWNGYKKIGSKTIEGYACDGYRYEDDHGTTEVWVTREDIHGMEQLFTANSNAKQLKGRIPENYPYGMIMEMSSENSEGEKFTMEIINIRENANVSYAMKDYPFMSLGKK